VSTSSLLKCWLLDDIFITAVEESTTSTDIPAHILDLYLTANRSDNDQDENNEEDLAVKFLEFGVGKENVHKFSKTDLRNMRALNDRQLPGIYDNSINQSSFIELGVRIPLITIIDFKGVRMLCQSMIPGLMEVNDNPELDKCELLFGCIEDIAPLRVCHIFMSFSLIYL